MRDILNGIMAGTLGYKRNRQGGGHGKRRHKHASGNGLTRYYFGAYQQELRRKSRPRPRMFATIREALADISGRLAIASWGLLPVA